MSDYLLSDVTNFQVIDMPYDVKLLTMDHFICNIWVIKIQGESNRLKVCNKLLIE